MPKITPEQMREGLNRVAAAIKRSEDQRWQTKETKRTGLSERERADRARGAASPLGNQVGGWWSEE